MNRNSENELSERNKSPIPSIELPKGGGAINGIGEKFQVNALTGTSSLNIPIYASPGRNGFGPQISLSYDSGNGNGPFGLGWNIGIASISRKTSKGIPQYKDNEESDVFLFSGVEDLVPYLTQDGDEWKRLTYEDENNEFVIYRYWPRIEGSFIKIEKWVDKSDSTIHWKTTSKEGVISVYGQSESCRVSDPEYPLHIFKWMIEKSYDTKGNVILYEYKRENSDGIDIGDAHEYLRMKNQLCFNHLYVKTIHYGNNISGREDLFHFHLIFDYGEHNDTIPTVTEENNWEIRKDPFSRYNSSFEIRQYRLCKRVLMFHEFDKLGNNPVLVRSTELGFDQTEKASLLKEVLQKGFKQKADGTYQEKAFPPVEFDYTQSAIGDSVEIIETDYLDNLLYGVDGSNYQWLDLEGEGLPGIFTESGNGWYYKNNRGEGTFTSQRLLREKPYPSSGGGQPMISDFDSDGTKELVLTTPVLNGYFEKEDELWQNFISFESYPNIVQNDSNLKHIDLNGDGFADILISEDNVFTLYRSLAKKGYDEPEYVRKTFDENTGPAIVFADAESAIYLADMSGDGLTDIVRIRNGEIVYWPNMGYGKFGAKITMSNAPYLDYPDLFNQRRVRLFDIDGTGTTDLIYCDNDAVKVWYNNAGNSWSEAIVVNPFPTVDDLTTLSVVDLLGLGTGCLVWSSSLQKDTGSQIKYIKLMSEGKPYLMASVNNNMGKETVFEYTSSTEFYLEDLKLGTPWITKLHFPVHVVKSITNIDHISSSQLTTSYKYHHGYYDGEEREFRGFGMVEQTDAESFETYKEENELDVPPVYTKTWFHTGAYKAGGIVSKQYATEYFSGDDKAHEFPDSIIEEDTSMDYQNIREAYRCLKGKTLRQEIYSKDGSEKEEVPFTVTETNFRVRQLQKGDDEQPGVFLSPGSETLTYSYERDAGDPRIAHAFVMESDKYGHPLKTINVAYPRRKSKSEHNEQDVLYITAGLKEYFNDEDSIYLLGVPLRERSFEINGITLETDGYLLFNDLETELTNVFDDTKILDHHIAFTSGVQARIIGCSNNYFSDSDNNQLAFGKVQNPVLPHHSEQMVMTEEWVTKVFGNKVDEAMLLKAGYMKKDSQWWNPGMTVSYLDADHFYLPFKTTDPFGIDSKVSYDNYSLAAKESEDAKKNKVLAELDYRTLALKKLTDINDNTAEAISDPLGMVIATSISGSENGNIKGDRPISDYLEIEGPSLEDIVNNPQKYLQQATSFFYYNIEKWEEGSQPPHFVSLQRETHVSELEEGEETKIQIRLGYSDAFGRELQSKVKVDDGKIDCDPDYSGERWLTSGRTIYNNKEKPIKQYEPNYRPTYEYETEEEFEPCGVTPVIYYDPMGRVIKTETPKGFHSKVEFNPWKVITYDENDTVKDTDFYDEHIGGGDDEAYALAKAAEHYNTPTTVILDSLAREFKMIQIRSTEEEELVTITEFDIQGNPLTITDPRQVKLNETRRETAQVQNFIYQYDLAGNALHTQSVDAGESWGLVNVMGNPVHAWNGREFHNSSEYDELQRPIKVSVEGNGLDNVVQLMEYVDNDSSAKEKNLNGQMIKLYDQAGLNENKMFDFHGLLTETSQQLRSDFKNEVDWSVIVDVVMESEIFTTKSAYDALGRVTYVEKADGSTTIAEFHAEGWLNKVEVKLKGETEYTSFIQNIDYNAKGQRTKLVYGNEVRTTYAYEKETYRLTHLRSYRRESGDKDTDLQDIYYTYDPVGNITCIEDLSHEKVFYDGAAVEAKQEYTYDALYQLEIATGREHNALNKTDYQLRSEEFKSTQHLNDSVNLSNYTRKYNYDIGGNLTEIRHIGKNSFTRTNIVSPTSNRAVPDGMSVTEEKVEDYYDEAGNLVELDHIREINWNYRNNIASAIIIERKITIEDENGVEQIISANDAEYYVYDGSGQRIRKVKETYDSNNNLLQKEEKIYLNGLEIKRKYQGATLKEDRSALHVMDDQKRIAIVYYWSVSSSFETEENKIHYQLGNHLGCASMELDNTGQLISYEEYFPFGGTSYTYSTSLIEVSLKEYRYTGKEQDDTTALYYFGARYYAPWMGRWLSADPAGKVDGLNLSRFVKNNPVNGTDRNGNITNRELVDSFYGVDNSTVEKRLAQDNGPLTILELTVRQNAADAAYGAWNILTAGFVDKQDALLEQRDSGEITEQEYWTRTGVDAAVSTGTVALGAGTGKLLGAGQASRATVATVGAAEGITTDLADQTSQVLTDRQGAIDYRQTLVSGATGALFGALGSESKTTATQVDIEEKVFLDQSNLAGAIDFPSTKRPVKTTPYNQRQLGLPNCSETECNRLRVNQGKEPTLLPDGQKPTTLDEHIDRIKAEGGDGVVVSSGQPNKDGFEIERIIQNLQLTPGSTLSVFATRPNGQIGHFFGIEIDVLGQARYIETQTNQAIPWSQFDSFTLILH